MQNESIVHPPCSTKYAGIHEYVTAQFTAQSISKPCLKMSWPDSGLLEDNGIASSKPTRYNLCIHCLISCLAYMYMCIYKGCHLLHMVQNLTNSSPGAHTQKFKKHSNLQCMKLLPYIHLKIQVAEFKTCRPASKHNLHVHYHVTHTVLTSIT